MRALASSSAVLLRPLALSFVPSSWQIDAVGSFFYCMCIYGRLAGYMVFSRYTAGRTCPAAAPEPTALRPGGNKVRRFARCSRFLGFGREVVSANYGV